MDVIKDYVTKLATEKQQARSLIQAGVDQLRPLNDDLATQTAASDGVVLFGFDRLAHPGRASALVSPERKYFNTFGETHIRDRFLHLGGTALKDETTRLRMNPSESRMFVSSNLNPTEQLVWTDLVFVDGHKAAAIQAAINPVRNNGLIGVSDEKMLQIVTPHRKTILEVARAVADIPIDNLELGPETTPNAYTIRWDIRESTRLATGKNQGRYLAYKQALTDGFRKLLEPFSSNVVDAGDGQNIVVYLPTEPSQAIAENDTTGIKVWGRQHLAPLIRDMQALQHELATTVYPMLNTTIRLSVDLGRVIDQDGTLDSDSFSLTAKEMKQRPSVPVTYTERASFLERTN